MASTGSSSGPELGPGLPDMSHLSPEEQAIILEVMRKQRAEDQQEMQERQKADSELYEIERQIDERKENALRLVGTQDDAICQICQKTKFADGIGHKCLYCQLRSCARCGGKTKTKERVIWACSLCQKRQQLLARTGKWFEPSNTSSSSSPKQQHSSAADQELTASSKPNDESKISSSSKKSGENDLTTTIRPTPCTQPFASSSATASKIPIVELQTINSNNNINGKPSETTLSEINNRRSAAASTNRRQSSLHKQNSSERSVVVVNGATTPQKSVMPTNAQIVHQQQSLERSTGDDSKFLLASRSSQNTNPLLKISHQRTDAEKTSHPVFSEQQQSATSSIMHPQHNTPPQKHSVPHQPSTSSTVVGGGGDQRRNSASALLNATQNPLMMFNGCTPVTDDRHLRQAQLQNQQRTAEVVVQKSSATLPTPLPSAKNTHQQNHVVVIPPALPPSTDLPSSSTSTRQHQNVQQDGNLALLHQSQKAQGSSSEDDLAGTSHGGGTSSAQTVAPNEPLLFYHKPQHHQTQQQHFFSSGTGATEQDFSEKDVLKYIYEQHTPSNTSNSFTKQSHHIGVGRNFEGLTPTPRRRLNYEQQQQPSTSAETAAAAAIILGQNIVAKNRILMKAGRNHLAASWRPSADQQCLIGHILLVRQPASTISLDGLTSTADGFGLKVTGARSVSTGKSGAFISGIKPGSIADTIGRLRTGDEVLEWNGICMQNLTPEAIYNIVQASKGDQKLELIVSRPNTGEDSHQPSTTQQQYSDFSVFTRDNNLTSAAAAVGLPHSQSLITPLQQRMFRAPPGLTGRSDTPLVFHPAAAAYVSAGGSLQNYAEPIPILSSSSNMVLMTPRDHLLGQAVIGSVQICGQIEMSLLYLTQNRELVVSLSRAIELPPRPDGSTRNSYVKIFLLPERSERSRRQSKIVADTLAPVWNEFFVYDGLSESAVLNRVLEITVWDYDMSDSHNFLGETLVDLSTAPLNNHPYLYNLLDMDEENPIRNKFRQRRFSSMTPPTGSRSHSYVAGPRPKMRDMDYFEQSAPKNAYHHHDYPHKLQKKHHSRRSRHSRESELVAEDELADWTKNNDFGRPLPNGYISDREWNEEPDQQRFSSTRNFGTLDERHHFKKQNRYGTHKRRPRSATAERIASSEVREENDYYKHDQNRDRQTNYRPPNNRSLEERYDDEGHPLSEMCAADDERGNRRPKKMTRQKELQIQEASGEYGSDGSETISVNSAQSLQNRSLNRSHQRIQQQEHPQPHTANSSMEENEQQYNATSSGGGGGGGKRGYQARRQQYQQDESSFEPDEYDEAGMLQSGGHSGGSSSHALMQKGGVDAKDRKKSLMTRLIPGRNGPHDNSKRTGFTRSEEVGIPGGGHAGALTIPEQNAFTKQASKESNDSSDGYMPIIADTSLSDFVKGLGLGQIVGRQAIASQQTGDLKVGLSYNNEVRVHVFEVKNLVVPSKKSVPVYVKAYLLEGKTCLAKGKTHPRKLDPGNALTIGETIAFVENPTQKMIQLWVIGDHGRIEKRSFFGVAQISLDKIQLSPKQQVSTYKLYFRDSLIGGGVGNMTTNNGQPQQNTSSDMLN